MRMRLAVATLLIVPLTALAADPPIVFQTQPAGRMLADVKAVVKMAGGDKAVKQFNDQLQQHLGAKGLDGLDLQRPILGYVIPTAKFEETVAVVVFPVADEKG